MDRVTQIYGTYASKRTVAITLRYVFATRLVRVQIWQRRFFTNSHLFFYFFCFLSFLFFVPLTMEILYITYYTLFYTNFKIENAFMI